MLSLVLGGGGLLVPTFAGMRDPLVIPGIAGAHDWREGWPGHSATLLGVSGALWVVGWSPWGLEALPRIGRIVAPPSSPAALPRAGASPGGEP